MPTWTPKPGTPGHFNLADEFLALITGDAAWSWLTPWLFYLGVPFYETASFCAQGPTTVPQLSISDFLTPTVGPGALADKLTRIARDRIFEAFCEVVGTGPAGWGTPQCKTITFVPGTTSPLQTWWPPAPVGTTHIRYSWHGWVEDGPTFSATNFDEIASHTTLVHQWQQASLSMAADASVVQAFAPGEEFVVEVYAPAHGQMCVEYDGQPTGGLEHTATAQPPVIGALVPTVRTYGSIADLGVELDHQEDKLDQLRQSLAFLIQQQASPSLAPDDVSPGPDLPSADPVDVPPGAIAAVVTVSDIPLSSNVELLNPQRYSRVCRITLGTADGWLPSLAIEHNPQLLVPLPPWAKLIRVSVYPPATATVRFLTKL